MSPENEHDIIESFHAMDVSRTGEITPQDFHMLCLGLGIDVERPDLDALILQQKRIDSGITVDVVLEIVSKVNL
jgi:hypothetical protein